MTGPTANAGLTRSLRTMGAGQLSIYACRMQSASEESVIILTTRMHPLTIPVFFVFRTIVAIDGVSSQLPWGEHTFSRVGNT